MSLTWPLPIDWGSGVNPNDIVAALVMLLQDIPDLVTAMGEDTDKIFAYYDRYPDNVSLEMAKYKMPAPGVMVAYQETSPASMGGFEVWQHTISVSLRAGQDTGDDTPSGFYRLFRLITKGVPASVGQALQYIAVHPSCQPMETPSMRRQSDAAGVDYFEVTLSFKEIGDD